VLFLYGELAAKATGLFGAAYPSLARGGAWRAATPPLPYRCLGGVADHLHCFWTLPEGDADFFTRWPLITTAFAKALPATEWRSTVRVARRERAIWHLRFWEHAIRDENTISVTYDRLKKYEPSAQ
jgi:hypothetical protein